MALGVIKDSEYDFIKRAVLRHGLRLTRNKENRTALNIIKAHSAQGASLRGQPNFKRKIWEFFETKICEGASFMDAQEDLPIHKAIKDDELNQVRNLIYQLDKMSGKATPEVMEMLEMRNNEGKTALFTAVEYNRNEIFHFLQDNYPGLNTDAKCTVDGNTMLHVAVLN